MDTNRNSNNNSPEPEDSQQSTTMIDDTVTTTETSSTIPTSFSSIISSNRQRSNSAISSLSLLKSAAAISGNRSGIISINNNNNNNSTTITSSSSSSIIAPVDLRIAANNLFGETTAAPTTTFSSCLSQSNTTTTTSNNHHNHHHSHHSHHNNNHLLNMSTIGNNSNNVQPQQQTSISTSLPAVFASSLTTGGFINSSFGSTNPLASVSANQILVTNSRKQREFIPDSKKDESYWDRRKRNNEAAKRSREKRRISDLVLETRVLELTRENSILKAELYAIKEKFGISQNQHFIDPDSVTLPLPENATKIRRSRLFSSIIGGNPANRSEYTSSHQGSSQSATGHNVSTSSFNYSCSLSPNSQSSSSSEVHVSTSPTYHGATANSSPPNVCPLLTGQQTNAAVLAGLTTPILPVLAACSSNKTTLPFKLRHKAQGNCSSNNVNSIVSQIRNQESSNIAAQNVDSDASSDSSSVAQLSSSAESNGLFGDHHRDSAGSPDSFLKTERFKSELQRLASEVASIKNVVLNAVTSGSDIGGHASNIGKSNNERRLRYHQNQRPAEKCNSVPEIERYYRMIAMMDKLNEPPAHLVVDYSDTEATFHPS
uniref:Uncharacterized protein DDB_G0288805-like n=1 Tax=Dermatophagoides pteronyssinus TaxID=6956 RepID=A0A6P6YM92_DERPT|nr:uncharacterized protein DDB_G0288805-like [Dermatophagoides pteronyssinus]